MNARVNKDTLRQVTIFASVSSVPCYNGDDSGDERFELLHQAWRFVIVNDLGWKFDCAEDFVSLEIRFFDGFNGLMHWVH